MLGCTFLWSAHWFLQIPEEQFSCHDSEITRGRSDQPEQLALASSTNALWSRAAHSVVLYSHISTNELRRAHDEILGPASVAPLPTSNQPPPVQRNSKHIYSTGAHRATFRRSATPGEDCAHLSQQTEVNSVHTLPERYIRRHTQR